MAMEIGWIGLGVMGLPMCLHLKEAGHSITIYCRREPPPSLLLKDPSSSSPPVTVVNSPASVAACSQVVFTVLGNSHDVRQIYTGPSGLLAGASPGCTLVDSTSSEPELARHVFSLARLRGCHSVDAPVSGNDVGARQASLSFMAGGEEDVVERLGPLFARMGHVTYLGPAGSGQICKLGNQIAGAPVFLGLVEGLLFAHKSGLDLNTYLKATAGGDAGSKIMDHFGTRMLKRDFAPGGMTRYLIKDLGTALRECQRMDISLPGISLLQQLLLSLQAHGEEEEGVQALLLTLERMNNSTL